MAVGGPLRFPVRPRYGQLDTGAHLFYLADVIEGKVVADRSPLCLHHLPEVLPPQDFATMRRLLEQDAQCNLGLL